MDHPNIAKVLDAGATTTGCPYFVMELVRGVRITDYCDLARLTLRERLRLLIPVCEAIQHAHQKGVIHRDIKPSNVLVLLLRREADSQGDRLRRSEGDRPAANRANSPHRGRGASIGTLDYMSPEQADTGAIDIDTRTDVYALGILALRAFDRNDPAQSTSV